jgi:hypothetical protein
LLAAAQGNQAIREGKDEEAVTFLRDAITAYDRQPENSAMLNNSANTYLALFGLTGDRRDFDEYVSRLEKGLTYAPSDALLLVNAAESLLEGGLWDVLGEALDLADRHSCS